MIHDIVLCLSFYLGLNRRRHVFYRSEIFIFTAVLLALLRGHTHPLFLSSFFAFVVPFSIENIISLPVSIGFEPWKYFFQIYSTATESKHYVMYLVFILTLFCFAQALNLKIGNKNIARKTFHFLGFLTFSKMQKLNILLGCLTVYISVWICTIALITKHLTFLTKEAEVQKDCYSLTFLVFILTYSQVVLEKREFYKLLISICILDSFASFTGDILKKKKKSCEGMIVGIVASCTAEFLTLKSIDVLYHLSIGMIEYRCCINDNIAIGLSSICYHLLQRELFPGQCLDCVPE
ncbi:uncharacterized protein VICG_01179 [Vittaforma corneae ATCC 50505]|uniref:Dolichol kinase n=1 Tax=Vittaforma corneae (strain ATCC 50505) TaxID=993615 RepID=L2GND3_VITCO|nr:uncharacterized protein VICG_01179 [Vittaforma corneae ATCC 50505]ELA41827.1 hypothetical protein VICG_01179 [Vittaforma corneae ATCC 50505]